MTKAKKLSKPASGKKLAPKAEKKGFFYENRFILLSFIVPFVIMAVGFAAYDIAPFGIFKTMVDSVAHGLGQLFPSWGITTPKPDWTNPWGDKQMLVIDLWHQYYPFLVELHEKLQSGGSLLHSWVIGMGSNFILVMSYYLLSPLNFLSVIVPEAWLVEYLALITVIKIACMGGFTAIAFRIITKRNDLALVVFSMMFSFCAFNMGYYWCVIWLDSVAMLPLCVAGTVALLRDGKFRLFTISLALAVVCNYFIGLFICVAVLFTCIGYECSRWGGFKKAFKDLARTAFFTVSALLMTAPVTIPTYLGLQNTYQQTMGMPKSFVINVVSATGSNTTITNPDINEVTTAICEILSNMFSFINPSDKEGLPNIACGVLCIILAAVFFCSKKIKLGEKLFCCTTLLFLVASLFIRHLDFIWHGFHYPNMLPARFSFLLSFLLIYMAYRAYTFIEHSHYLDVVVAVLAFVLLVLTYFTREADTNAPLIASCIVAGVYIILLFLYSFKLLNLRTLTMLLCLFVFGEMVATSVIGVKTVTTTSMAGYPRDEQNMDAVLEHITAIESTGEPDIYRTEVLTTQTLNDSALNTYNGVSMFNSMANVNITKYLERIGLGGWQAGNRYTYYESSPVTNVLLNLKYLISRDGKYYNTEYTNMLNKVGNTTLLENTAYLPMGYVANDVLINWCDEDFSATGANGQNDNPFLEQIEFWKLATGIKEPVYKQLKVKDQGHTSSKIFEVGRNSDGHYSTNPKDKTADIHTKFNYYPEEDGTVLFYFKADNVKDKKLKVMINDQDNGTRTLSRPNMGVAGVVKAGDKVSLYTDYTVGKSTSITVYCYMLNDEVFKEGLEILSKNGLVTTKSSDTKIQGTVNSDKDGLFFTSIPYEKGWKAYVDGEEVEITPIANAMVAFPITEGQHEITLKFIPHGFLVGVTAFAIGFIMLAAAWFVTSKYMKENRVKAMATTFFKADVKIKEKPVVVDEVIDTASEEELTESADSADETSAETDETPETNETE
ncbi:MAG: YfhO family protein [Clostridia bacterium]|nr:YfhO family protein [Clostridia bacterium]